jgi:hypothetical protein
LLGGRCELPAGEDVWFEKVKASGVDFGRQRFGDTRPRERPPGDGREDWRSVFMDGCVFEDCDFSGATFDYCDLGWGRQTIYRRCRFDEASMRHVTTRSSFTLGNARFENCTFLDARMRMWFAHEAEFVGCRFRGTLDRCTFFGRIADPVAPPRRRNEFRGNDFREAELVWCSFREVPVRDQLWPESPEYVLLTDVAERARRVGAALDDWPAEERRAAEMRLDLMLEDAGETDQWFGRRREPDDKYFPPELTGRYWALLEQAL